MKTFDDVRSARTEPDLLTEEQLTEGLLRKGAAVGLFAKSSGHRKKAQSHFTNAQQSLRTNAGDPIELQVKGLSIAMKELTDGLSQLTLQVGALGSISLTAVLLQDKSKKRR